MKYLLVHGTHRDPSATDFLQLPLQLDEQQQCVKCDLPQVALHQKCYNLFENAEHGAGDNT